MSIFSTLILVDSSALATAHMEAEETLNPWITVPKRKRNRTFGHTDATQNGSTKSEVESLHPNSFINLSLQESMSEDSARNGVEMASSTERLHPPTSPGIASPPRKRTKKDPKKVCLALIIVDVRNRIIQQSKYEKIHLIDKSVLQYSPN